MKLLNNERGGALLMVLLIVLVFSILGMSLLAMNISAAKQFNKKEETVQARHQAEMGVLHYKAEIEKHVAAANGENLDNLLADIGGIKEIKEGNYNVKWSSYEYDDKKEVLKINIISKGKSKSSLTEKEIEAKIVIENPGVKGGEHVPPQGNDVETKKDNFIIPKGGYYPNKENLHLKGNLDAVNGNKDTNMTIINDLYIEGNIEINNHSCMVVGGDLTVLGSLPKNMSGKVYIVVNGNAYFNDGPGKINNAGIFVRGDVTGNNLGDLNQYSTLPPKNSCPNIVEPKPGNWFVHPNVYPEYK